MFDSLQCNRPFDTVPLVVNWGGLNWLRLPLLLAIVVVLVSGLGWLVLRKQRRIVQLRWLTVLMVSALVGLSLSSQALTFGLPSDPGTPVEAIVILGRGPDWQSGRIAEAVALWKANRSPLIFASGINDTPRMLAQLTAEGIPNTALDGENCSLTTPQNALFSAAVLQPQKIQSILLITDGPHLRRSLLDFQSQGFSVIPHMAPLPAMPWIDQTILSLRETLFLITSSLHELQTGERVHHLNDPILTKLVQQAYSYGEQKQKGL